MLTARSAIWLQVASSFNEREVGEVGEVIRKIGSDHEY